MIAGTVVMLGGTETLVMVGANGQKRKPAEVRGLGSARGRD